jgi:hypothetical protein
MRCTAAFSCSIILLFAVRGSHTAHGQDTAASIEVDPNLVTGHVSPYFFADYYHWENGIGNGDKRPEVYSPAWQEWDPNDFGIDEFMQLARELNFEPSHSVTVLQFHAAD